MPIFYSGGKKMKKKMMTVLAATMLFTGVSATMPKVDAATNKPQIEVLLDARKMAFPDAKPFQDDSNAVMVPIRFVSEKLGAKVGWSKSAGKQVVTLKTDKHSVSMTVGSATAVVDGESKTYDSKIILKQSRTFVPLRLVSEGLGQTVNWDQIGKWVWIGSKEVPTLDSINLNIQSITPFKKYFQREKADYYLKNSSGTPYQNVINLKSSNLPLKMNGTILYDLKPATINGVNYIQMRTDKYPIQLEYLTKFDDLRTRSDRNKLTTKNSDGTYYHYFELVSYADQDLHEIFDKNPLTIKDLDFLMFFSVSEKSLVLMSNPWSN